MLPLERTSAEAKQTTHIADLVVELVHARNGNLVTIASGLALTAVLAVGDNRIAKAMLAEYMQTLIDELNSTDDVIVRWQ